MVLKNQATNNLTSGLKKVWFCEKGRIKIKVMKTHNALFFIKNVHQLVSAIKEIKKLKFLEGSNWLGIKSDCICQTGTCGKKVNNLKQ